MPPGFEICLCMDGCVVEVSGCFERYEKEMFSGNDSCKQKKHWRPLPAPEGLDDHSCSYLKYHQMVNNFW